MNDAYIDRLLALHAELRIPQDYSVTCGLPLQLEARDLVDAGLDMFDRPQRMTRRTLDAWTAMRTAALQDGVSLLLVSAYRSVDYQCQLIRGKLEAGQPIDAILSVNAAPGYSEHHTGRALDLATPGSEPLTEDFELTPAFAWLQREAGRFDFRLSFPRGNASGIQYEPWHWALSASGGRGRLRTA